MFDPIIQEMREQIRILKNGTLSEVHDATLYLSALIESLADILVIAERQLKK